MLRRHRSLFALGAMKAVNTMNAALCCLCCLLLCSCSSGPRAARHRQAGIDAWCYVTDLWTPPISFSLDEITTRSWNPTPERTVQLMKQETFRLEEPGSVEILAAWFGSRNSDRTECIDFYAAYPNTTGMRYYLLCHDEACPPYKTEVLLERTSPERPSFRISGNVAPAGAPTNYGKWYYYELKPKWRMIRHLSDFLGAASQ